MESNHKLSFNKEVDQQNPTVTKGSYDNSTRQITLTRDVGGAISFPIFFKKTTKAINTNSYTLTTADQYRWLVFEVSCTVTVPSGMAADDLFEGESYSGATLTFVAGTNVTLRHVASISKTLSPNGVFGVRFRAANNCILYGTDPTN